MVLPVNLMQSSEELINIIYLVHNGSFCSSNSHWHISHLFFQCLSPPPPLGKCPLGYQQGVPQININNTGWARVFPSTPMCEMFSYQLRANLCWRLFSAINQFSRSDRIKQSHKHISSRIAGCAHRLHSSNLWLSVHRKKKINGISEPIVFLAIFQLFIYTYNLFFWLHAVFQSLFSLITNFSDKLPCFPWAASEVCHGANSPVCIPTPHFCCVRECFGGHFLLTRTLGVALP